MRWKMRPTSALAAITLALTAIAGASGPAAAETVIFNTGTYSLAKMDLGHPVDTLDLSVSAGMAMFVISGEDNATFTAPDMFTQAGGAINPNILVNGTSVSGSWNATEFPFITFWSTASNGGLTIGSGVGDQGANFINLFQSSPGTGQVFSVLTSVSGIPEPATWAMLVLGVGLIGGGLRVSARSKEASLAA
jgi:hypothetical protein